ncbi:MAG TPA: hypothetical protein VIK18_14290, partial [Pirellulales bacterium]
MHMHRSMSGVEVWTPAKLNLFLEVLARRADGYHEIETLMVPVDWYDTLHLTACPSGRTSLTCRLIAGSQAGVSADPFELPPA